MLRIRGMGALQGRWASAARRSNARSRFSWRRSDSIPEGGPSVRARDASAKADDAQSCDDDFKWDRHQRDADFAAGSDRWFHANENWAQTNVKKHWIHTFYKYHIGLFMELKKKRISIIIKLVQCTHSWLSEVLHKKHAYLSLMPWDSMYHI